MMSRPRVLLTGATGHLGAAIAAEILGRREPPRLRLLVRSEEKLHRLAALAEGLQGLAGCERVVGDIRDPATLAAATDGVDTVIHNCHSHEYWRGTAYLLDVNLEGARRLAAEVRKRTEIRDLIYIGSYSCHDVEGSGPRREELEQLSARAASSAMKATVQQLFTAAARADGFRLHVISPSYMIGPYQLDPTYFGALFHFVHHRPLRWCPPHGINLIDVRDVARAVADCVTTGDRPPQRLLAGGDDVPFRDLFATLNRVAGYQAEPREVSPRLLRSAPRLRHFGDFGKFYFDRPHYTGLPGLAGRRYRLAESVSDAVAWARRLDLFMGAADILWWMAKRYL